MLANAKSIEASERDAIEFLMLHVNDLTEPGPRARMLDAIAEYYDTIGDVTNKQLALEKSLQLEPADKSRRFKLAYSYSEDERTWLLSLWHYKVLEEQDYTYSPSVNNLGVVYENFGLKGKKIETWKIAARVDAPYPSANLASELIEAGFWEEAETRLREIPDEHKLNKRVVEVAGRLERARESEKTKIDQLSDSMRLYHRYMLLAIERDKDEKLSQVDITGFFGEWADGDRVRAALVGAERANAIKGSMVLRSGGAFDTSQEYSLALRRCGVMLVGQGREKQKESAASILGGSDRKEISVLLVYDTPARLIGIYWADPQQLREIKLEKQ